MKTPIEVPASPLKKVFWCQCNIIDFDNQTQDKIHSELYTIIKLVNLYSGYDFFAYKSYILHKIINNQMLYNNLRCLNEYASFLKKNTREVNNLFKCFQIGVTSFFRDLMAFEVLKTKYIYPLLKNKKNDETFRVWIPGCSTGEEAYSIAILIAECLQELKREIPIQIFATDINISALLFAQKGLYPEHLMKMNKNRLNDFFIKNNSFYTVKNSIRETIIFAEQDLLNDFPISRVDLISCRNVLIYLKNAKKSNVILKFYDALHSKGVLFLGSSEVISGFLNLFNLAEKQWKIFIRKNS